MYLNIANSVCCVCHCRDEPVMFIEALAALDPNPGSLLVQPPSGSTLAKVTVQYKDAVRAAAAHLYKHISVTLARCIRAALAKLQADHSRLALKLNGAAAALMKEGPATLVLAEGGADGDEDGKGGSLDERGGSAAERCCWQKEES